MRHNKQLFKHHHFSFGFIWPKVKVQLQIRKTSLDKFKFPAIIPVILRPRLYNLVSRCSSVLLVIVDQSMDSGKRIGASDH